MSAGPVLAVRHAPVDAEGLCYGQIDVPTLLSAAEYVDRVADAARAFAPDVIWSSDAARCEEPAGVLATALGIELRVDVRLRELSYGSWEGRSWKAIDKNELDLWMRDWTRRAPPGGETTSDLLRRVGSWWKERGGERHLMVAHAGVMHALRVASGVASWEETMRHRIDYLDQELFAADG